MPQGRPAHTRAKETEFAPSLVDQALRSAGRPLEPAMQQALQPRFSYDLSRVRIHTGGLASASARAINANAYTVGRDIVFGEGAYAPGTAAGNHTVAHELTHVVQESRDGVPRGGPLTIAPTGDAAAREADAQAGRVVRGFAAGARPSPMGGIVQRQARPQAQPNAPQPQAAPSAPGKRTSLNFRRDTFGQFDAELDARGPAP